ncbi:hypothetical protein [Deinococcus hopiensis]|uniref:Uncharacterized protein n=1 Tax=Deinococcus hopiensis KR-140 TaxID=695939 RepID=A0A1W1VLI7_9DEIO|nr:hypothetical protein [Deinococcus hopiensis]SMB94080.1 hypothetical protein SAMN00790413_02237 [Deinococcus hopiensis KR-140]
MTTVDRFGLEGNPEVQRSRRVPFGTESFCGFYLVFAWFYALVHLHALPNLAPLGHGVSLPAFPVLLVEPRRWRTRAQPRAGLVPLWTLGLAICRRITSTRARGLVRHRPVGSVGAALWQPLGPALLARVR